MIKPVLQDADIEIYAKFLQAKIEAKIAKNNLAEYEQDLVRRLYSDQALKGRVSDTFRKKYKRNLAEEITNDRRTVASFIVHVGKLHPHLVKRYQEAVDCKNNFPSLVSKCVGSFSQPIQELIRQVAADHLATWNLPRVVAKTLKDYFDVEQTLCNMYCQVLTEVEKDRLSKLRELISSYPTCLQAVLYQKLGGEQQSSSEFFSKEKIAEVLEKFPSQVPRSFFSWHRPDDPITIRFFLEWPSLVTTECIRTIFELYTNKKQEKFHQAYRDHFKVKNKLFNNFQPSVRDFLKTQIDKDVQQYIADFKRLLLLPQFFQDEAIHYVDQELRARSVPEQILLLLEVFKIKPDEAACLATNPDSFALRRALLEAEVSKDKPFFIKDQNLSFSDEAKAYFVIHK